MHTLQCLLLFSSSLAREFHNLPGILVPHHGFLMETNVLRQIAHRRESTGSRVSANDPFYKGSCSER